MIKPFISSLTFEVEEISEYAESGLRLPSLSRASDWTIVPRKRAFAKVVATSGFSK